MKIKLEGTICCDECNETIYAHFDCPSCGEFVQWWGDPYELEVGESIECEKCHSEFKLVFRDGFISDAEWEKV